jgi:carboxymethylenebutenolidase
MLEKLNTPLLGLFGADDGNPDPAQVAIIEEKLKSLNKTYEFHSCEGAGHAFFSVDRPNYRQPAAADGWQKVFAWFEKYLTA